MSSVSSLPVPGKSGTTQPVYDPNLANRRCPHCGQRDHWLRLEWGDTPGGWFCACSPLPDTTITPSEMRHVCTIQCAVGGAA